MIFESTTDDRGRLPRVVVTGGGTGGHVSPAVAVVQELRSRMPVDVVWVGSRGGFEEDAAARLGVPFRTITVGKLRRYPSFETLVDTFRVPFGVLQARRTLHELRPDVVFSTGGYVSVPTVVAARTLGVPAITHEQTALIGFATRINARFCDVIALSYESSRALVGPTGAKVIVTGNPVRDVVLRGTPGSACTTFDLPGELPLVYITGGAQGSRAINAAVRGALPRLLEHVEILHQYGPRSIQPDYEELPCLLNTLPNALNRRYRAVERVGDEIGDVYASAALVVGRAGAGTVAEVAAVGLPAILIPLPGAREQRRNAQVLVERDAAVVLPQDDLTPQSLTSLIVSLHRDAERLEAMRRAARQVAPVHPAKRLADEILKLAGRGG